VKLAYRKLGTQRRLSRLGDRGGGRLIRGAAEGMGHFSRAHPGPFRLAPGPLDAAPAPGTGSPSILESVRDLLAEGPSSGSALAKRLGVRKARVLDVLHELEAAGEVVREGENRGHVFRAATPEERPGASAPESQTGNSHTPPPDDPFAWIDAMVRDRWAHIVASDPRLQWAEEQVKRRE